VDVIAGFRPHPLAGCDGPPIEMLAGLFSPRPTALKPELVRTVGPCHGGAYDYSFGTRSQCTGSSGNKGVVRSGRIFSTIIPIK
jgi:hypothetical protein